MNNNKLRSTGDTSKGMLKATPLISLDLHFWVFKPDRGALIRSKICSYNTEICKSEEIRGGAFSIRPSNIKKTSIC